ncbi:hypothetical protein SAMN05216570_3370 [Dyella sp. OK004]|uniref:hypothetical protein n=1 Tax=Dyella sp. OK004 TaxID=1855292 RepID=UPI0008E720B3|nr:hypothetical protein [Dyella sp. OK004]SFS16734.1 hypothetical protein SAMN05216570_3370 [Dyella sp. OK004]
MSDVINFLERMGQDAELRYASQDTIGTALADAQIEPQQRSAVLASDPERLRALLGHEPLFATLMMPGAIES